MSKSAVQIARKGKGVGAAIGDRRSRREASGLTELHTRVELIQPLTPIGLEAVDEVLQREVCQLPGER